MRSQPISKKSYFTRSSRGTEAQTSLEIAQLGIDQSLVTSAAALFQLRSQPPLLEAPPLCGNQRSRRPKALGTALFASLIFAVGLLLYFFEPGRSGFYPLCLFHQATGLLCPGCGCLRAAHQLLHGNFLTAVHFNAFFVLSSPFALAFISRSGVQLFQGRELRVDDFSRGFLWCFLIAGVLFGVLRNLPFAHQFWLAP